MVIKDREETIRVLEKYFQIMIPGFESRYLVTDHHQLVIRLAKEYDVPQELYERAILGDSEPFGRALNAFVTEFRDELIASLGLQEIMDAKIDEQVKRSVEQAQNGWIEEGYQRALKALGEGMSERILRA